MALNLGELYATMTVRRDGWKRGLTGARADMAAMERDTNVRLSRIADLFTSHGNRAGRGLAAGLAKATVFAAVATGAAGAASAMGPLLSTVATLGTALVGLGAAVPAFAVAGAAVIGTLTIAFQGLGEAIAGDEEALERLPGPAREFVGVVQDLKDDWDDLTRSVQGTFFEGLSGQFKTAANTILPHLKRGLTGVADGLSDVAASALDAADSPRFLAGMNAVLGSTETGLKTAAEGMGGFIRGFGTLMEVFAPLIERAGLAVANLGDRFEEWMEHARATGQLNGLIDTMLDTLSTLGGIVVNIGSVFGSVFSAANTAGGGLLGVIESLTGRLAEFFRSAEGQTALGSFFSALASVADAVVPIVVELAKAFGEDLAPHFATIAEEVGPSLKDLVQEIGDAIGGIDVKTLAQGFADVLDAITPMIEPLGDFLAKLSEMDGIVPIIIGALAAWTIAQWALNIAMYANPIVWIIAAIIALIAVIVLLVMNWDWVKGQIILGWETLKDVASTVWNAIKDFFVTIFTAIGDFFVTIWTAISDFFTGIWDSIVGFVTTKVNQFLAVMDWFASLPGKIGTWFQGVYDSAKNKLSSLIDWVKSIPDKITSALGNLGDLLWDAGRDIIQGLLDGIESMWDSVQNKLSDLTSALPDWKGPASTDRVLLTPVGEMIIGGLLDGFDNAIPQVMSKLQGLTTDIGMAVTGGSPTIQATASLSEEDRELLRELAQARNRIDIRTDANTRAAEIKRDAMVAGV